MVDVSARSSGTGPQVRPTASAPASVAVTSRTFDLR